MLLIASAVVLVFVRVVVLAALVVPLFWLPKSIFNGLSVTPGFAATPVPLNTTCSALSAALSINVRSPERVLVVVGIKVTVAVQEAPVARLVGQLLVWLKSFVFNPCICI